MICYRSFVALLLLAVSLSAWSSDQYWAYNYKDIDVTAIGGADRAKDIANNLHRLDRAIGAVLGLQAEEWRPPTRVYAVPQATFDLFWKRTSVPISSSYYGSSFASDILINASLDLYFDAYYGYANSVLVNAYPLRFPLWYRTGFSQVFGASKITRDKVTIGGYVGGRVVPLFDRDWIPVKTLFSIQLNDPQLASADYLGHYEAECWFLTHQVLVEQIHHQSFVDYFSRLEAGEDESNAFSESFLISHEELDKELRAALARGIIKLISVKLPDEPGGAEPRRLSESEAKGRLARLAAAHAVEASVATELANQALAGDPKNEDALIALTQVQLRNHDWSSALQAAQRWCTPGLASASAAGQCASIYAQLLYGGAANSPTMGLDAHALADQSRNYYEIALRLDPEDLEAWNGMGVLLVQTRDVENAKGFLPRAKHAWAMHSTNENLSRSLAGLCALTGDFDSAIKFAQVWQKYALTGKSSVAADTYLSRLRMSARQKQLNDPPPTSPGPPAPGTTP